MNEIIEKLRELVDEEEIDNFMIIAMKDNVVGVTYKGDFKVMNEIFDEFKSNFATSVLNYAGNGSF